METHLYFLLFPEALVMSMLKPEEFGTYLATGTTKRTREQAIYFELKSDFDCDYFDLKKAQSQCIPHQDGRPKHTVYVSTYRVLEHIPVNALGDLWLSTRDGRSLVLQPSEPPTDYAGQYHLYQELCPVHPLIVSQKNASDFNAFITNPEVSVSVPRICFVELELSGMAEDPTQGDAGNLPYKNISHIRDCLSELASNQKSSKTINRIQHKHVPFRCVKTGFFVGDQKELRYYRFPSLEDMQKHHHSWWRSAEMD